MLVSFADRLFRCPISQQWYSLCIMTIPSIEMSSFLTLVLPFQQELLESHHRNLPKPTHRRCPAGEVWRSQEPK
jgi:hypothetical protein